MQIVIIGCGYVGLVSGACFAELGHEVICADVDRERIALLQLGQVPIFEPGLADLVARNVRAGRLSFSACVEEAVIDADAIFIAVGTPPRASDGHADLSSVYAVARTIGSALRKFAVIVSKSTVPVGTADEIERLISEQNRDADYAVVSNPEFLREGSAIADFMAPDRIVVGTESTAARQVMEKIYAGLINNGVALHLTARRSAELIKYAANAFLALKITFINEIAELCEAVGSDVEEVAAGVGADGRIGSKFLRPGPGFGGSCFPKDTLALVKTAQDSGQPLRLIETMIGINEQRKRGMARKVITACGGSVRGKIIAILGLTFKADTDDVRGAPSLDIVRALQDKGANVRAFDPAGMANAKTQLAGVRFVKDVDEAVMNADAAVIVTDWKIFANLEFDRLRLLMRQPVLVDLRNVYRGVDVLQHGFSYSCVGRSPISGIVASRAKESTACFDESGFVDALGEATALALHG